MCQTQFHIMFFLMVNFTFISYGQSSEVKIEIPGKADFIYDGLRIQVESTNTLLGQKVGQEVTSGLENTFLGKEAGLKNSLGSQNTFVGSSAGLNNVGSGNVFIGYQAGFSEEGDEKLYIANKDTSTPLIYGDFRQGLVEINDHLNVNRDLYVDRRATVKTELIVEGLASLNTLNITSGVPSISFFAPSLGSYRFTYHPSQDRFFLTDDDSKEVLEVKNGDLRLPEYAGARGGNLTIDENGTLLKTSENRTVFNRYEFHRVESFTGFTKLTRGVQFADGTVLSGIKALLKDNNTSGSTGVGNTAFAGIYRVNKFTGTSSTISPIYRIDGSDTATGTHEEFTQTNLAQTGANVIDNANYIYLIQVFICDDCDVSEVVILE